MGGGCRNTGAVTYTVQLSGWPLKVTPASASSLSSLIPELSRCERAGLQAKFLQPPHFPHNHRLFPLNWEPNPTSFHQSGFCHASSDGSEKSVRTQATLGVISCFQDACCFLGLSHTLSHVKCEGEVSKCSFLPAPTLSLLRLSSKRNKHKSLLPKRTYALVSEQYGLFLFCKCLNLECWFSCVSFSYS